MGLIMNYDNSLLTKYHHLNNTAIVFVTIKRVPFTYQLWERDENASFRYITRVHYKFPPHLLYSLFIMPIYALITASRYNDALINVRGHTHNRAMGPVGRVPSNFGDHGAKTYLRLLQTISENSFIWRPKRLVTLLNL